MILGKTEINLSDYLYDFCNAAKLAREITGTIFKNEGNWFDDNKFNNAFKHAMWAFLMANSSLGLDAAKTILANHEFGEIGCSTEMDVANNLIGIGLYESGIRSSDDAAYLLARMELWIIGGSNCIVKSFR